MKLPPTSPHDDGQNRLDYASSFDPPPLSAGERAGIFTLWLLATPLIVLAGVLGVVNVAGGRVTGGVVGALAFAVAGFFGLVMMARDRRHRTVVIAGAMSGFGVCALLIGACFAMFASIH